MNRRSATRISSGISTVTAMARTGEGARRNSLVRFLLRCSLPGSRFLILCARHRHAVRRRRLMLRSLRNQLVHAIALRIIRMNFQQTLP